MQHFWCCNLSKCCRAVHFFQWNESEHVVLPIIIIWHSARWISGVFEVLSTKSNTKRRKNEGRSKHLIHILRALSYQPYCELLVLESNLLKVSRLELGPTCTYPGPGLETFDMYSGFPCYPANQHALWHSCHRPRAGPRRTLIGRLSRGIPYHVKSFDKVRSRPLGSYRT